MPCDCCSTDPCTCEDPRVVALRARVAELEAEVKRLRLEAAERSDH